MHGAYRRAQELLREIVGGGFARVVAAPVDADVDDVAVAQHEVGERVREGEPLQHHGRAALTKTNGTPPAVRAAHTAAGRRPG